MIVDLHLGINIADGKLAHFPYLTAVPAVPGPSHGPFKQREFMTSKRAPASRARSASQQTEPSFAQQQQRLSSSARMLGNPTADNPFATSDPFGPSRTEPASDDFDNVDIGNNAHPTSSSLYGGPVNDGTDAFVPAVPQKKTKANRTTKDLEKRERELDKREQTLAAREAKLAQSGNRVVGTDVSNKNWPRCRPLVRHHIGQDVPPGRQRLVRLGYLAWLLMFIGFCWNWLVVLIMFIAAHKKLSDWLFASLICGFGLPLSFFLWYFNLYKGAIRDSSFRWWWYFIWAFLQPILCGWIAIAPPVVGNWCAGGFTMINQFRDGHGAGYTFGIFCVINLAIWALAGFMGASATSLAMKNFRGRAQNLGGDVQMQAPV